MGGKWINIDIDSVINGEVEEFMGGNVNEWRQKKSINSQNTTYHTNGCVT